MKLVERKGVLIAVLEPHERIMQPSDLLDIMSDVGYWHGCRKVVVDAAALPEGFFDLSTRIAGELLQKCSNYRLSIAITGDFSSYGSKSLRAFMYECNQGNLICFVPDVHTACERLGES